MDQVKPDLKSCGFLVFREKPKKSFLLMQHPDRWDLPKGHVDDGETELQTALRELQEETGIEAGDIEIDPDFRFSLKYTVRYKRSGNQLRHKELVVFLASLIRPVELVVSEHDDYKWFPWQPPQQIQTNTIDPLLHAVAAYWSKTG
jgi:8-oxo-dGTP pyrophosphatase MutT (NUDIX family)